MQARRGQAAVDEDGGYRGGGDGFAGATSVLRTNVTMDEEASRFDIQLFADD